MAGSIVFKPHQLLVSPRRANKKCQTKLPDAREQAEIGGRPRYRHNHGTPKWSFTAGYLGWQKKVKR
jgi:hypothetical protein